MLSRFAITFWRHQVDHTWCDPLDGASFLHLDLDLVCLSNTPWMTKYIIYSEWDTLLCKFVADWAQ